MNEWFIIIHYFLSYLPFRFIIIKFRIIIHIHNRHIAIMWVGRGGEGRGGRGSAARVLTRRLGVHAKLPLLDPSKALNPLCSLGRRTAADPVLQAQIAKKLDYVMKIFFLWCKKNMWQINASSNDDRTHLSDYKTWGGTEEYHLINRHLTKPQWREKGHHPEGSCLNQSL